MSLKEMFGPESHVPLSLALKAGGSLSQFKYRPSPTGRSFQELKIKRGLLVDKIKSLLEEAGSSMDKVIKTTVFLQNKADFSAMNAIYAEYFSEPLDC